MKYTDPNGEAVETVWDVLNLVMDVKSAYDNFSAGNIGAGVVDVFAALGDAAAVAVPGLPGGIGAAIKSIRAGDKALGAAKAGDKVVDAAKLAVHSKAAGRTVGHHEIPKAILKTLDKDVTEAVRGKKGAPNVKPMLESLHKKIHGGPAGGAYNRRFREEIEKLRSAGQKVTASDVERIRDQVMQEVTDEFTK